MYICFCFYRISIISKIVLFLSCFADYGVDKYDIGTGFGHFAIATENVSVNYLVVSQYFSFSCMHSTTYMPKKKTMIKLQVYKLVEDVRAKGGKVTREPGPVKGGTTVIAFVADPDGYIFELIQRGPTPEPLCQVMLRVGDLERSIKFYEKVMNAYLV